MASPKYADVAAATSQSSKVDQNKVTVVLVQGFMAPKYSHLVIYHYLKWKGWTHVEIFNYDSKAQTIEFHGEELAKFVAKLAKEREDHTFYFYCTSMGNLVLRVALQREEMPDRAKSGAKHVAIGPPWRGAAWGRWVDQWAIARWISGDGPGRQLRKTPLDGFDHLGNHPPSMSTLVIYGDVSYNIFIPRPNDGTIAVEETYLRTPHWRICITWGTHWLFSYTPSALWNAHRFFLGDTTGLEYHGGLEKKQS